MKYRAIYQSPTGEKTILGVGTTPERAVTEAETMKTTYYGRIRTEFPSYRDAKLHQATHGGYIMQLDDGRCLHYALGYTRWEAMEDAARSFGSATCRTFGFNEPHGYDGEIEREFLARRNMLA